MERVEGRITWAVSSPRPILAIFPRSTVEDRCNRQQPTRLCGILRSFANLRTSPAVKVNDSICYLGLFCR